jgi:hypothetical protein
VRRVWGAFAMLVCIPAIAKPKPAKMVVTLHQQGVSEMGYVEVVDVLLILPDGSHAKGHCITAEGASCLVESFAPEKRVVGACKDVSSRQHDDTHPKGTLTECTLDENYYADRKVNDITLYGAKGGVTYHIVGSW